ncbi:hypothetical protein [Spirosoma montaniterrae]|uniref:Uncharacterized protein n=1 Tax=Spirosoma montaniterrae TaxID=1178516 RepID=A0A1P9X4U8_9BACT|nr:hypothetical protein [Spirosoma montaniterrae]AQG82613.1 hypothetical protein AWR27_20600 [Spirosoma montaniterrae]
MKKTTLFLMVAATLVLVEVPLETQASAGKAATETSIFKRKRKGYKPKRGGLFNTGLFRKKNPCGCPKH